MRHLTVRSVVNDFKGKKKLTELVKASRLDSYSLIKKLQTN
jgi:hypothetical protein